MDNVVSLSDVRQERKVKRSERNTLQIRSIGRFSYHLISKEDPSAPYFNWHKDCKWRCDMHFHQAGDGPNFGKGTRVVTVYGSSAKVALQRAVDQTRKYLINMAINLEATDAAIKLLLKQAQVARAKLHKDRNREILGRKKGVSPRIGMWFKKEMEFVRVELGKLGYDGNI